MYCCYSYYEYVILYFHVFFHDLGFIICPKLEPYRVLPSLGVSVDLGKTAIKRLSNKKKKKANKDCLNEAYNSSNRKIYNESEKDKLYHL